MQHASGNGPGCIDGLRRITVVLFPETFPVSYRVRMKEHIAILNGCEIYARFGGADTEPDHSRIL